MRKVRSVYFRQGSFQGHSSYVCIYLYIRRPFDGFCNLFNLVYPLFSSENKESMCELFRLDINTNMISEYSLSMTCDVSRQYKYFIIITIFKKQFSTFCCKKEYKSMVACCLNETIS